jgi:hypothetical protein
MSMQRAVRDREVVAIAAAPRQERGILLANERHAQNLRHDITIDHTIAQTFGIERR